PLSIFWGPRNVGTLKRLNVGTLERLALPVILQVRHEIADLPAVFVRQVHKVIELTLIKVSDIERNIALGAKLSGRCLCSAQEFNEEGSCSTLEALCYV